MKKGPGSASKQLPPLHGLSPAEYRRLKKLLGREPVETEMGILGAMWSEHCSYKSSKVHLKRLHTKGEHVVQGPGENAGIVQIEGDLCAVFKIESHNHPSYIEPFQGAATGVGGIIRDILAMGARPVALMDALRFGSLKHPRTRYLAQGVVAGIGFYGNCVGVPTVGGEIQFHRSFDRNCLVNAFCLGLVRKDRIARGLAAGIGNPLVYVGAKTGRDGIHGATMASAAFGEKDEETKRPNVQIADPFMEKLLIEVCLEAVKRGWVVGMQDMGAAGLINSTSEMAHRAGTGVDLDLDQVPLREPAMTPYETVLSESQERMVLVVPGGREHEAMDHFRKWGLNTSLIGRVADHHNVRLFKEGKPVTGIPTRLIVDDAPRYRRPYSKSRRPSAVAAPRLKEEPLTVFRRLLESPNVKSKRWVWEQYDWSVGTQTVAGPGADAAVLRIRGSRGGLAMTVDANPRWCFADAERGTILTVIEAFRNLACVGAEPLGLTNCLNFGNPENRAIMGQFVRTIDGLRVSSESLRLPVVSGNVSFYNETEGEQIYPTPTLAAVGWIPELGAIPGASFRTDDDIGMLVGQPLESHRYLPGSEALAMMNGSEGIPGHVPDFAEEKSIAGFIREGVRREWFHSVHDISEGGLAVALMESCLNGNRGRGIGVVVDLAQSKSPLAELYGEGPPRYLVSVPREKESVVQASAARAGVTIHRLGKTGGESLEVAPFFKLALADLRSERERLWE